MDQPLKPVYDGTKFKTDFKTSDKPIGKTDFSKSTSNKIVPAKPYTK